MALTAVPHSTSQGIWSAESTCTARPRAADEAEGQLQNRGLARSAGQQFLSSGFSCCVTSMPGICSGNGAVSKTPFNQEGEGDVDSFGVPCCL